MVLNVSCLCGRVAEFICPYCKTSYCRYCARLGVFGDKLYCPFCGSELRKRWLY